MLTLNPPQLTFAPDTPSPALPTAPGVVTLGNGGGSGGSVPAHLAHQVTPIGPATMFGKKKQPLAAPSSPASSVDVFSAPAAAQPKTAASVPSVADESAKESYFWQQKLQEAIEEAEAWRKSSEEYQGYLQAMRKDRDAWKARALAPGAPGAPAPLPALHQAAPKSSGFPWMLLAIGGGAAGLWLLAKRRQASSTPAPGQKTQTKKEAA